MADSLSAFERLVTFTSPRSPVAEAYRALRTSIQFSTIDKPIQTLLATSTGAEEGKSTTLANLAVAIAQTGASVLLVDCDLRRPNQHRIFGLRNTEGLTTLALSESRDMLPIQDTVVPNLRLLAAGPPPPNPSELLGSRRMSEIMTVLKSEADFVLFDTPPIIAVTDAAVLASKVDGVLMVIRAGKTKRDLAKRAKDLLGKVNANIVGVVLTDASLDSRAYHYYASDRGANG